MNCLKLFILIDDLTEIIITASDVPGIAIESCLVQICDFIIRLLTVLTAGCSSDNFERRSNQLFRSPLFALHIFLLHFHFDSLMNGLFVECNIVSQEHQSAFNSQFVHKTPSFVISREVILVGFQKGLPEALTHDTLISSKHFHKQDVVVLKLNILHSVQELVLFNVTIIE